MKRFAVLVLLLCGFTRADYLGSHDIDGYLTIMTTVHDATGAASAADGDVDVWIYEDDTDVQIVDQVMAAFDSV